MGFFSKFFGSKPNRDKFAKTLLKRIRAADETVEIVYDPDDFSLSSEEKGVLSLQNAFAEFRMAEDSQREDVMARWARAWFTASKEIPEDFEDIRPDLLPVVRGRAYFDITQLRIAVSGEQGGEWPYQPIGEHLGLSLVYDMHEAMRSIRQDDLDEWGVTFYEAIEIAMENLRELPTQFSYLGSESEDEESPGVYISACGDSYDASRLLIPDLIDQFNILGRPIAMIPTRNMLIVTGEDDAEGLRVMSSLAEDASEQPGYISTVALVKEDDRWEPWLPPQDHPLFAQFKLLRLQCLTGDYNIQKELLDELHEKQQKDVFVASCSVIQNEETGLVRTYCVWSAGIESWLPETDLIAFVSDLDGEPKMFTWDQAVAVVGDLMTPLDMYPPRFDVRKFPSVDRFAAMGAEEGI